MAKKDSEYHIVFLRHAESVGNAEGYFQGQGDFPLTKRGREQANALAIRWQAENREFDHLIASPLTRTKDTAEIIAAALGMSTVHIAPRTDAESSSAWIECITDLPSAVPGLMA